MQNSVQSINRIDLADTPDDFHRVDPRRGDWRNYVNEPRGPAAQGIEDSIKHMLQHMDKPLRVSTLSSIAGVSHSRFFLLFKEATGYSPIDYLIRLRMECACKMLMDQTVLIKQIAAALGYDDQFYFSRSFKATMGVGPSAYRRKQIGSTLLPVTNYDRPNQPKNRRAESTPVKSTGLVSMVSV